MDRVENIVTKEEIAHYGQFLLLSRCFQMSSATKVSKGTCMWDWVKGDLLYKPFLLQLIMDKGRTLYGPEWYRVLLRGFN